MYDICSALSLICCKRYLVFVCIIVFIFNFQSYHMWQIVKYMHCSEVLMVRAVLAAKGGPTQY